MDSQFYSRKTPPQKQSRPRKTASHVCVPRRSRFTADVHYHRVESGWSTRHEKNHPKWSSSIINNETLDQICCELPSRGEMLPHSWANAYRRRPNCETAFQTWFLAVRGVGDSSGVPNISDWEKILFSNFPRLINTRWLHTVDHTCFPTTTWV